MHADSQMSTPTLLSLCMCKMHGNRLFTAYTGQCNIAGHNRQAIEITSHTFSKIYIYIFLDLPSSSPHRPFKLDTSSLSITQVDKFLMHHKIKLNLKFCVVLIHVLLLIIILKPFRANSFSKSIQATEMKLLEKVKQML